MARTSTAMPTQEDAERAIATVAIQVPATYDIYTATQYDEAVEFLRDIKGRKQDLEKQKKLITAPLRQAMNALLALFKEPEQHLNDAENGTKRAMVAYQKQLREAAEAEAARRRDEAEKERKKLEARADKLEEKGKAEQAEALREQAETVQAPVVYAGIPKSQGIQTRTYWRAEVTDLMALVKAVAAGEQPITYLEANQSTLNAAAKASKKSANIPGVRVYSEDGIAARA